MELDGYNKELSLAFEYHGEQHFKYVPFFHKKNKGLRRRIADDKVKRSLCLQRNVTLLEITYSISADELYSYIIHQLKKAKVKIPKHKRIDINNVISTYSRKNLLFLNKIASTKNGFLKENDVVFLKTFSGSTVIHKYFDPP